MRETLTTQEAAALEIACLEGGFAGIGNWSEVAESLERLGYLVRRDRFNFDVTPAGRKAWADEEGRELREMMGGPVIEGRVER